jgi:hypothetical protein
MKLSGLLQRVGLSRGSDDRRRRERRPVVGEVTIIPLDQSMPDAKPARVFIRNVSAFGCGVWSRWSYPVGTNVMIVIPRKEGQPPIQRLACVRHCRGSAQSGFAVGLCFDKPVDEERG